MTQLTENAGRGRRSFLGESSLLQWEGVWIELFCSLRDGVPQRIIETRGTSGIYIKASLDEEKHYLALEDEMREQGGRETLFTMRPGSAPKIVRQPKIMESPDEMAKWQAKVQRVDADFQRIAMGDEPMTETAPAIPGEPHIWEALKRARTAAQVRRAYSRSKIWLISRIDFPGGGFQDWSWSPYPRALYRHAAEFCKAKLDSRYPVRDKRVSGDYRRIEYLGRVMAGLSLDKPISPSYSVERLRKIKHLDSCGCWRCVYEIAPRYPRSLVQFLSEGSFEIHQP